LKETEKILSSIKEKESFCDNQDTELSSNRDTMTLYHSTTGKSDNHNIIDVEKSLVLYLKYNEKNMSHLSFSKMDSGSEIPSAKFRFYKNDPFRKLLEAFFKLNQDKIFLSISDLQLKFDGIVLGLDETPNDYSMQDLDRIDVVPILSIAHQPLSNVENLVASKPLVMVPNEENAVCSQEDTIHLKVRRSDKQQKPLKFKIGKKSPMEKMFQAFISQESTVPNQNIKFFFDGRRISPNETPETLELEDYDMIDAVVN